MVGIEHDKVSHFRCPLRGLDRLCFQQQPYVLLLGGLGFRDLVGEATRMCLQGSLSVSGEQRRRLHRFQEDGLGRRGFRHRFLRSRTREVFRREGSGTVSPGAGVVSPEAGLLSGMVSGNGKGYSRDSSRVLAPREGRTPCPSIGPLNTAAVAPCPQMPGSIFEPGYL
ncbi:hypothetical protein NPIL_70431 [Nephila pilipes]|uniref:Uncharacterized protein n=1 Tax=Nephila pilipes TaxID=299642 RepID=A0A8X6U671_NEPPI|nr:hypothetical protein NPIL_70431 [Nephila pilipes]